MIRLFFIIAILGAAQGVHAQDTIPKQWMLIPKLTLNELLQDRPELREMGNGKIPIRATIESTDGLNWPDGRTALVTMVKVEMEFPQETKKNFYRCVDYYTRDFQQNGFACYELREPFK